MVNAAAREAPSPSKSQVLNIVVRGAADHDIPGLAALFSEMQRHYQRPVTDEQAVEAARLACRPVCTMFDPRVVVAAVDATVVGSIVMNVTFPAFELTRALYIRDLYISQSMRRHGVGQALVKAAAHLAFEQGFSALDWTTESGNAAARHMYESCGARVLPRTYYRLAREDIKADLSDRRPFSNQFLIATATPVAIKPRERS